MRKYRKMISLIMLMVMLATMSPYQVFAADATTAATTEEAAVVEESVELETAEIVEGSEKEASAEIVEEEPAAEEVVEETTDEEVAEEQAVEEPVAEEIAIEETQDAEKEEADSEESESATASVDQEKRSESEEIEDIVADEKTAVTKKSPKGEGPADSAEKEEKTSVCVQITWDDNDNIDGGRPESIDAQLYAVQKTDTGDDDYNEIGDPVAVTEEGGWQYTWENLDKKDNEGNVISYEVMVNYMFSELSYNETEDGTVASVTIVRYPYLQIWDFFCVWNDADNVDKARPESVSFQVQSQEGALLTEPLVLSDEDEINDYGGYEGNYAWKGMIEYYPGENEIQSDLYITGAEGYDIINYHTPGYMNSGYPPHNIYVFCPTYEFIHKERPVSINKVDADSGEEVAGAVLQVLDKNGKVVTTRDEEGNTVPAEWTSTADGKPHVVYGLTPGETYTLHEVKAPGGYETAADTTFKIIVEENEDGSETRTVESTGTVTEDNVLLSEGTFINKTDVHVQIKWEDEDNYDGTRPESIEVQLYANNKAEGEPVYVTEKGDWQYTWKDLDKKSEGKDIEYRVSCSFSSIEIGYEVSEDGTSFTYTFVCPTRKIVYFVKCVWNDADDADKIRPEKIALVVQSNDGEALTEPIIISKENWGTSFTYKPGKTGIEKGYQLVAMPVEGYEIDSYRTPGMIGGVDPFLNSAGICLTFEFKHKERPVSINKVDISTGEAVAGAKLQVLDKDGKIVTTRDDAGNTVAAEWISTADGKPHVVYGLTPGETYTLHEAAAPEGYEAAADSTFKIVIESCDSEGHETRSVESTGTVTEDGVILCEGKALPKTNQTPVCTVSAVDAGKAKTFAVTGSYGALTVKSSNAKVATATVSGTSITVKGAAVGTATLTITAAGDKTHNAATITCTVKVTPTATGKLKATAAANGKGFKLTWAKVPGAAGYVIYRNDKKIKTVGNVKTYTDAKANTNGAKYTYKVYAKAATGTSSQFKSVVTYKVTRPAIKALANSAAGKMTAKWSKNAKATGYQLQYCTKSTFKGKKTITMPKNTKVSKTIPNLTKGKTYYVRLRTYKKVGGKTYFSAWGVTKKVSIKK